MHSVNDHVSQLPSDVLGEKTHIPCLEDKELEGALGLEDDLLRMGNFDHDLLRKIHEGFLGQHLEESQLSEDALVGVLNELATEAEGETADKLAVRFVVEVALNLAGLAYEVVDLEKQIVANVVLLSQAARSL